MSRGAMTSRSKLGAGVSLLIVFGALFIAALIYGPNIDGTDPPSSQCDQSLERPSRGGPFFEGTKVSGEKILFPLGIVCIFDSPTDAVGPQAVIHQQWLATFVMGVSFGLTGYGIFLIRRFRVPAKGNRKPFEVRDRA